MQYLKNKSMNLRTRGAIPQLASPLARNSCLLPRDSPSANGIPRISAGFVSRIEERGNAPLRYVRTAGLFLNVETGLLQGACINAIFAPEVKSSERVVQARTCGRLLQRLNTEPWLPTHTLPSVSVSAPVVWTRLPTPTIGIRNDPAQLHPSFALTRRRSPSIPVAFALVAFQIPRGQASPMRTRKESRLPANGSQYESGRHTAQSPSGVSMRHESRAASIVVRDAWSSCESRVEPIGTHANPPTRAHRRVSHTEPSDASCR
ncbi:hypothetical protein C8R43DRAFT_1122323 [Mycena crocata]|nr:hypothetical protein C8R43DRAFT_1122323 [Mycena crocata]